MKDATKRLTERNMTHPCTFCGRKPDKGYFRLRDIGRYPGGEVIERPVCEECSPLAEPLERGLSQVKLLEGLPLPPAVLVQLGEHDRSMNVVRWCIGHAQREDDQGALRAVLLENGFIE